jgi:hypothetical protein
LYYYCFLRPPPLPSPNNNNNKQQLNTVRMTRRHRLHHYYVAHVITPASEPATYKAKRGGLEQGPFFHFPFFDSFRL